MLKRLLVGINGTQYSQAAAKIAIAWAKRHHAELVGLGIVDVPYLTEPELVPIGVARFKIEQDKALVEAATAKIVGYLAEFESQCAAADVRRRILRLSGTPEELLPYEAQCTDLLVLGKKSELYEGRAAASRVLRQTVRHATRPVLCVDKNDALDSSEGPVLVAYDGSSHAAKSLQIFNTLGLAHGREIHLVLVAKDSSELHTIDMAAEYLKTFGHEVHAKIRPAGLSIGTEILADARLVGASLIVMGAYGQSPVRELFFGSVTSAILKDSNSVVSLSLGLSCLSDCDLAQTVSELLISAAAIVIAGSFLTHFADAIAEVTGLGRLVVGSVLLASATSLPELTVDISAVSMGMPNLAVGDLLGSSLMNLLILAVLDLSHQSRGRMLSRQSAAHALSGLVSASLAALVALGIVTGKVLVPYSILGLSPGIIALVVAYLLGTRLIYVDTQESRRNSAELKEMQFLTSGRVRLREALFGFAGCAGVICVAGPYLAKAAGVLAERSGLGDTFIGTTLVALATSLPELVSMVAALRIGAIELAIGNVFGSNAFNVLLLVP